MNAGLFTLATFLAALSSFAQGTFQYDQQSLGFYLPPNVLYDIQPNVPIGQSFVPSLAAVGFVQFELFDGIPHSGVGATVYVNLRSNSITGPILSSTAPVFMPDTPTGGGITNLLFSAPAAVVPGTTYFFEIVVQSGDLWRANVGGTYSPGTAYFQGNSQPFDDLWFREGIIIPEPSTVALLITAGTLFCVRRKK
jgi:hypothetical protein